MNFELLKQKPFYLNDNDINWVKETLNSLTVDEKIGQLFCFPLYSGDKNLITYLKSKGLGTYMLRSMPLAEIKNAMEVLYDGCKVPPLVSANLEEGPNGACAEAVKYGNQMQIAASNDPKNAYKLGEMCGRVSSELGIHWSYAPVSDIDFNFRNPITNTRTYGNNPEFVSECVNNYIEGLQKHNVAAAIKHFPGDGVDERDQHLVTSINSLSTEEWDKTYGMVYKNAIDAGVMSVMVGHIALPSYSKALNPNLKDEDILPGSLSYEIVTKLLKEKLGFNGLVCTDATVMGGFTIPMHRKLAVPKAIMAGCDVFLFSKSLEEDLGYMKAGYESGLLTSERLDEACMKVLALKASLKLHEKPAYNLEKMTLEAVNLPEDKKAALDLADNSITIVKEEKDVLPLSVEKYPRVLLYDIHRIEMLKAPNYKTEAEKFKEILEARGYKVDIFVPDMSLEGLMKPYEANLGNYDLMLYIANIYNRSNETDNRIDWDFPMGANVPYYVNVIPTVFVSVANPYHLLDAPRVKTYINTYESGETVLNVLLDKLEGKSKFKGVNPIDPFCGKWDTKL